MWILYALLSAIFAAATAIFAKLGLQQVDAHLATAIRTIVVLLLSWGIVFLSGAQKGISLLTPKTILFLILSGAATGLSWLFYFQALQLGEASKVAPIDKLSIVFVLIFAFIFLKESIDLKTLIGALLICAGTLVMLLPK